MMMKVDKIRNPKKLESNDSEFRLGRNPCFKTNKILHQNWVKMKNNLI